MKPMEKLLSLRMIKNLAIRLLAVISLVTALLLASASSYAGTYARTSLKAMALKEMQDQLVEVISKASKSVVTVMGGYNLQESPLYQWYKQFEGTPYEEFFKRFMDQMQQSPAILGSGVIVSVEGSRAYIVTNSHVVLPVIQSNLPLKVKLYDGTLIDDVTIINVMTSVDLALLEVRIPLGKRLYAIPFADSSKIKVGQFVIAIGNPFGLEHTVTLGIVSATGRKINTMNGFTLADMIQTDAALNPGNSGGALVDIEGRLVGINTAIYSPTRAYAGIGFAIPSNIVKQFISASVSGSVKLGSKPRAYLGVVIVELPLSIASRMGLKGGVMVTEVKPGSPAEKGGLLPQDIIVQVDDKPILTAKDLVDYISSKKPGDVIKLRVYRMGRTLTLRIRLGRR